MLLEYQGKRPHVPATSYIAPTATLCGGVTIGENCRILFGAIIVAEGGPVTIGADCIIMENAVIRGTPRHPVRLGTHVLVGPRTYLTGCTVEDDVFLATGATIFNGARIGARAEVRINGVVHIKTSLPPDAVVPIGWVAVGDPVHILPPNEHDQIWAIQEPLNFPREIFGLERAAPGETIMPELTRRYGRFLAKHTEDKVLDEQSE